MAEFGPPPVQAPEPTPFLPEVATPDAFGAPIAAAAEQAGASAQASTFDARRILLANQYDADLSAAQVRAAQLRPQMQQAIAAIQGDPDLKLPDYAARVSDTFDQLAGSVTDGVTNPKIARIVSAQVADMRSSYATEAGQWQTVQTAGQTVGNLNYMLNTLAGQADANATPENIGQLQQQFADAVHTQQGLTPDQRSQVTIAALEKIPLTYASALAYSDDPAKVGLAYRLYQNGWFEQAGVKSDALRQIGRMVDSRMAHVQAQQNAQTEAQIAGFTVSANSMVATVEQGGNVPIPQLEAAASQARAMAQASEAAGKPKAGLFTLADRLDATVAKVDVKGRYGALPPQELVTMAEAAEADNARKVAAGQPVSLADGARVAALREMATQTQAAVQTDPWSLAATRGIAPAPLNPADPHSYAARAMQAQQLQAVLKLPYPLPPLQKDEAEALGKQAASSDQGRMAALASLDHFDMGTRDLAARQVMPGDGSFAVEAGLDPFNRTVVQQGRERMAADKQFWTAKPVDALPGEKPPAQAHIDALNARIDVALQKFGQTDVAGVKIAAQNWIAGMLVRQGRSAMTVTDDDVQHGIAAAMGGHAVPGGGYTGGVASWGTPNNIYAVPTSMNAAGFSNFVNRQVAADRRAGHGPVNVDGTPFNLTQAAPVFVGHGTYEWHVPGGIVTMPKRPDGTRLPYLTRGAN